MAGRLNGKIALVVGAGSIGPGWGNGKATAVLFAREGAKVLCADVDEDAAKETADLIAEEGNTAKPFRADVSSHDDIRQMVQAGKDAYGPIDVLDYNVGLAHVGGVVELPEEEWDRIFAVNLKGCYLTMKHVIPIMEQQGGGSIVNISSIAGIRYTGIPYSTYYATKAAMIQLTRTTAVQYAPKHVRVNTVLPGLMKTPMVEKSVGLTAEYGSGDVDETWKARDAQCPMGHMGDAWDVAYACLYLASDESKYVTGIELVVDGGITLKCNRKAPLSLCVFATTCRAPRNTPHRELLTMAERPFPRPRALRSRRSPKGLDETSKRPRRCVCGRFLFNPLLRQPLSMIWARFAQVTCSASLRCIETKTLTLLVEDTRSRHSHAMKRPERVSVGVGDQSTASNRGTKSRSGQLLSIN